MGWADRRRRKKLKKELTDKGKLNVYHSRLKQYIKTMTQKEVTLVEKIKSIKDTNTYQAKLLIQQVNELSGLIKRVQRVEIFLESYETKQETELVYEDFLNYLNEAKKISNKPPSKRQGRKALNRTNRQIKDMNQLFKYIDQKIVKYDKSDLSHDPMSSDEIDSIDVEAFLKKYE